MTAAWIAAALVAGYTLGRWRPARGASDWAHSQGVRKSDPHDRRWWLVWLVLSAENIGWLITHPAKGAHAWQHRNDPPPHPAIRVRDITEESS
jgi:hypothetical protein